jgi:predicted metal-dependent TIM-barrel fold hydrolase
VLVTQLDFTSLRIVLDAGCWAGVTVNPFFLSCEEASELIYRFGDTACDRVIVNSRLQDGVKDVLALPKLALLLAEQGFTPSSIRRLVWTNAWRLFERQRDSTS